VRHVPIDVPSGRYEVVVGPGARHGIGALVAARLSSCRAAAIVTQQRLIDEGWLDGVDPGVATTVHVVGEGEGAKSLATAEQLCREFVGVGLSRRDVVVGVGGGVVTDLAGFVASVHLRGVALVLVPTTVLGQIDAAIGGKNAVNLPEGKNLVGTFHQPLGVLCDTAVLATLPAREWSSGNGELAKYALLAGDEALSIAAASIDDQVARCAELKGSYLVDDERDERGRRAILNYGHTLAHALESSGAARGGDVLRHGEAVAVGLSFAALLAERLGRIDHDRVQLHDAVLTSLELDATVPDGCTASELVKVMARDKKAHHSLTFVLDGPAGFEVVDDVDAEVVLATLRSMGAA
jgi:5-deoxy-5-amino-3-dehydroquinate synthase